MTIRKSTMAALDTVRANMGRRGVSVAPANGSILHHLNNLSVGATTNFTQNGVSLESLDVEEATGEVHTNATDRAAKSIAAVIVRNWTLAQDVVMPMVKAIITGAEERAASYVVAADNNGIVPLENSALWDNQSLQLLFNKHEGTEVNRTIEPLGLETGNLDFYLKLASTGMASIDSVTLPIFTAMGEATLDGIYKDIFVVGSKSRYEEFLAVPFRGVPRIEALLVLLWARQLIESQDVASAANTLIFQRTLNNIIIQTSASLATTIKQRGEQTAAGVLILGRYSKEAFYNGEVKVTVDDVNYSKYLQAGGKPEGIMGAALTGGATTINAIIAEQDTFVKAWETFATRNKEQRRLNRWAVMHNALVVQADLALQGLRDCGDEVITSRLDEIRGEFAKRLGGLGAAAADRIPEIVRTALCEIVYKHTMVLDLLRIMEDIESRNPTLEPNDLAVLAIPRITAQWLRHNMVIEKN